MRKEKTAAVVAAGLCVLLGSLFPSVGGAEEETGRRRVVFGEGFEGDGKMTFWATNGSYEVNFAGPTDQRAAGGKRSFKIDVTWKDCAYNYWQSAPLMVPYYGKPKVSGKLYVERGGAQLGYANACPEAETAGNVSTGEKTGALPDGWSQWVATAGAPVDSARHVQAVAIYLRPDKEGRSVVYVDDLEVEAALPDDYEAKLKSRIARIVTQQEAAVREAAEKLRARLPGLAGELDAAESAFPESASPALAECWRQRCEHARQTREDLQAKMAQLETAPRRHALQATYRLSRSLEKVLASSGPFIQYARTHAAQAYVVWIVEPISNEKVLPQKFPVSAPLGTELAIRACRGEYEPASFAVYAPEQLRDVTVHSGEARCGDLTIPASRIDVRIVKCWWQAGVGIGDLRHPTLTPELLLKDPDLVRVDNDAKRNVLRNPEAPRDAKQLRPISIPAGSTQQFWVTVHVPEDAQAGTYRGTIRLDAAEAPPLELGMTIEVLPFRLEEPLLEYSIYYRGRLTPDGKGSISSEGKSQSQYLAEMLNLKAHGVTHPTCYQPCGELLDRIIRLRKQAGITVDPYYSLGLGTGAPQTAEALEAMKRRIRAGVAQFGNHGIKEVYSYGIDEASGSRLKAERDAFNAVHQAGAKVFVACSTGAFELVGDLLDLAIHAGRPLPEEAEKWHGAGQRIFSYANPQVGVEEPETYRRNFGLALWQAGYDGACNYAYQHAFGHIWDDFDNNSYRDHVFTYPTVDGVIDTIQWEGFREGVDDVRYLTTLLGAIEQAKANPAARPLAAEAEKWVAQMDLDADLGKLRAKMVEWTVRLSSGSN